MVQIFALFAFFAANNLHGHHSPPQPPLFIRPISQSTIHRYQSPCRNRPLRGFATRGEANTPSVSECREVRAQPRRPPKNDKMGLTCFIILRTIDLLRVVELHGASSALPGSDRALERGLPASRSFLRRRFPDVA